MTDRIPDTPSEYTLDELNAILRDINDAVRRNAPASEREELRVRLEPFIPSNLEAEWQSGYRIGRRHGAALEASKEAATAAYCREHTHCADWPLCGHSDEETTR